MSVALAFACTRPAEHPGSQEPPAVEADPTAAAEEALPVWPGLPPPFRDHITASVRMGDGVFMLFNGSRAIVYTPSAPTDRVSEVIDLGIPVDAALRWNEDRVMLFSGFEASLVDVDGGELAEHELTDLTLPPDWDGVDAAARYDVRSWIFFRGGVCVLVPIPVEGADEVTWMRGIALKDWFVTEWTDGVDAAVSLGQAGVLAVFKGDRYKLIDLPAATITESAPYATVGATTPLPRPQ